MRFDERQDASGSVGLRSGHLMTEHGSDGSPSEPRVTDSASDSYAKAGVDVTAGYESVARIAAHLERTKTLGSIGAIGGFGGLFDPDLSGMKRPIAVSGTDGVGTKLKIAFLLDKHDTIGIDCVAMCVNDIICAGTQPYFFLDYIAMGKNKPERTERIVAGIADGCVQAGCALVGGETAEHPGMMPEDEYDLAGFAVGFVEYDDIIDGSAIETGDIIIGLASSGLHSNGFSLVRKILSDQLTDLGRHVPELGRTLGEELLQPTKIYVKPIMGAIARFGKGIKGIAHITGGGFFENIPRMLPQGIRAVIDTGKIPTPPIFDLLAKKGGIPERDMYNTFNMGVGLALCVSMDDVDAVVSFLRGGGETPLIIGRCIGGDKGVELTW